MTLEEEIAQARVMYGPQFDEACRGLEELREAESVFFSLKRECLALKAEAEILQEQIRTGAVGPVEHYILLVHSRVINDYLQRMRKEVLDNNMVVQRTVHFLRELDQTAPDLLNKVGSLAAKRQAEEDEMQQGDDAKNEASI